MTLIIDDDRYGCRTEFGSINDIRAAATELALDWECDPGELAAQMIEVAIESPNEPAA